MSVLIGKKIRTKDPLPIEGEAGAFCPPKSIGIIKDVVGCGCPHDPIIYKILLDGTDKMVHAKTYQVEFVSS